MIGYKKHLCEIALPISYSKYDEVRDVMMPKLWNKQWKRKRIVRGGHPYLLKIDDWRSACQWVVNEVKVLFEVDGMKHQLVLDKDSDKLGSLIQLDETLTDIGKAAFWLSDRWNLEQICKILILDGVVANSDRMVCNVLIRRNLKILAIDESDSMHWHAPYRCKFRKAIRDVIQTFAGNEKTWLEAYLDRLRARKSDITRICASALFAEDVSKILDRFDELPVIVEGNFGKIL